MPLGFVNYKKGVPDSQPQVIKFIICLSMVGGSLWVPPASSTTKTGRHDIAESGVKHNKSIKSNPNKAENDRNKSILKGIIYLLLFGNLDPFLLVISILCVTDFIVFIQITDSCY